ncbi:hypothetical protein IFM89_034962 [Coptis chinensis]|uniref:RNase H type-1 domain-containing protein n=1 Tax=Coptis chinensis TaxID=261450 RepID=A0A835J021_9MAGN|nr:hypothetical protein IFM89_034962 [Coptis chinensis]
MLNTDGSVQESGNGYGGTIRDSQGNVLLGFAGSSSKPSVIFQELFAIAMGLKQAQFLSIAKLEINSDSLGAINIINGLARSLWNQLIFFGKLSGVERSRGLYELATPFGGIIDVPYLKNDKALTYALLEHWWDTTHTTHSFHFPSGEATITPLDFSMLTRLSIGRRRLLQSNRSYETFETAQQLFPGKEFKDDDPAKALRLTPSNWTGTGIQCRWFEDRHVNYILEKPKGWELGADHEEEYILAFLFYMV